MAEALSTDLRLRAVKAYMNGVGTQGEVCKIFGISAASLSKYLRMYRETGSVEPKARSGGKSSQKLFEKHVETLKKYLEDDDELTNQELADKLKEDFGIQIDQSQVWRIVVREGLTRKKKSFTTRK